MQIKLCTFRKTRVLLSSAIALWDGLDTVALAFIMSGLNCGLDRSDLALLKTTHSTYY